MPYSALMPQDKVGGNFLAAHFSRDCNASRWQAAGALSLACRTQLDCANNKLMAK